MEFLIGAVFLSGTAHEVIGKLVAECDRLGMKKLAELSDSQLVQAHHELGPNVRSMLGVRNAVLAFRSHGSTAPEEVAKQTNEWQQRLAARPTS